MASISELVIQSKTTECRAYIQPDQLTIKNIYEIRQKVSK